MSVKANSTFYEEVVSVTSDYLGPAAHRFVARQVDSHLHKSLDQLQRQDLPSLIDWISLAMAVLVEDEAVVNEYVADLRSLTSRNSISSNSIK